MNHSLEYKLLLRWLSCIVRKWGGSSVFHIYKIILHFDFFLYLIHDFSEVFMLFIEYSTSKYANTEHLSKLKLTYKSDFWNTQQAPVHGQVYYGYQGVLLPWKLMQETCKSRTMLEVTDTFHK